MLLQELPFTLKLKKFQIEHYSTGQPKLFLSEVELTDKATKQTSTHKIEVNKPLIHSGIAIYQSSFDDGGSKLKLLGYPMSGDKAYSFALNGEVGEATTLANAAADKNLAMADATNDGLRIEFTGFRFFNIETIGTPATPDNEKTTKGVETSSKPVLGSEQKSNTPDIVKRAQGIFSTTSADPNREKRLQNVGPSVQYKLRDAQGQAREFHNYMMPVAIEGRRYLLSGVRENPGEAFRYVRMPVDKDDSIKEYMRLRAALFNPALREAAGRAFAANAFASNVQTDEKLRDNLRLSATKSLETFAGQGFSAVAEFIDKAIPKAEQEKAAGLYLRILNGAAWELYNLARAQDGLAAAPSDEFHADFLQSAMNAVSDSFFYGAPVYLTLQSFEEVKASVFQLTRSPGKNIVYLGSLLLVLGVFSMLYVRERRAWVLVKSDAEGSTALLAMSCNRATMDFEKEFAEHRAALFGPQ